jgi:hypothetical protein
MYAQQTIRKQLYVQAWHHWKLAGTCLVVWVTCQGAHHALHLGPVLAAIKSALTSKIHTSALLGWQGMRSTDVCIILPLPEYGKYR